MTAVGEDSAAGFLLIRANDADPGSSVDIDVEAHFTDGTNLGPTTDATDGDRAEGGGVLAAWISRVESATGKVVFNLTFVPHAAVKTSLALADGGLFVVAGRGPNAPRLDNPETNPESGMESMDTAAVIDLETGISWWNITIGPAGYEPYGQAGWSVVGPPTSQTLLHVTRANATAIDLKTGEALWTSDALAQFELEDSAASTWSETVVVNTVDGADGNSNTLYAVSLIDGTTLWQFPPKGAEMQGGIEAFIWTTQCTFDPPSNSDHRSAPTAPSGVCFLDYSCQKISSGNSVQCPASLKIAEAPSCGSDLDISCRPALDLATGKGLYTVTVKGIPDGTGSAKPLFRFGDAVIFDGSTDADASSSALISMTAHTGKVEWTRPCNGCAKGIRAFSSTAQGCTATLKELCAAAKVKGPAQCGMCTGEHVNGLHAAGCTDKQITSWCTSDDNVHAATNQTVLLAGSGSSLSGAPTLLALDPAKGSLLWSTPLGRSAESDTSVPAREPLSRTWSVTPLWVDPPTQPGGAMAVYVTGVYVDQPEPQPWIPAASAGAPRRVRRQIPPPPPESQSYYYTWKVVSA